MAEHNTDLNYGSFRNHQELMRAIGSRIQSKVDKVAGKGLSSNDYTTTEKIKLANIENGAQTNVIENIEVNGSAQPINNKTVAITVMTNAVDDLVNYYKKSETYTQEEVNNLIGLIPKFSIKVVESLPVTDISYTTVYLLKTSETETGNLYTEYIYVKVSEQTSQWEKLGTQTLDLSDYVTTTDLNNALANYTTTTALNSLLSGKVDKDGNKVLSTNDYADADKALVQDSPITVTATGAEITASTAQGNLNALTVYGKSEVVDGSIKSAGEGWATVDLGTLSWGYSSSYQTPIFSALLSTIGGAPDSINFICPNYKPKNNFWETPNNDMCIASSRSYLIISNSNYTDATAFKTAMSGVLLCYELADPTQGNAIAVKTDNGSGIDGTMATFTTGTPLRGIPDTNVRDVMTWDGSAGTVTKKCNRSKLTDLTWTAYNTIYYAPISDKINNQNNTGICSSYNIINSNPTSAGEAVALLMDNNSLALSKDTSTPYVYIRADNYTTVSDFVASLGDAELVYELATPTTQSLTSTENASIAGLRTFTPQTHAQNNAGATMTVEAYAGTENGKAVTEIADKLDALTPKIYNLFIAKTDWDETGTVEIDVPGTFGYDIPSENYNQLVLSDEQTDHWRRFNVCLDHAHDASGKITTIEFSCDPSNIPDRPIYFNIVSSKPKYVDWSVIGNLIVPPGLQVDTAFDSDSTNPVQNKVIKSALDGKATPADIAALIDDTTAAQDKTYSSTKVEEKVAGEEITTTATGTDLTLSTSAGNINALTIYGKSEVVDGAIKSAGEGWATVDLGTLNWIYRDDITPKQFRASFPQAEAPHGADALTPFICSIYKNLSFLDFLHSDKCISRFWASVDGFNVIDSTCTTLSEFLNKINGVILAYKEATPTNNTIAVKTDNGSGIDGTMAVFETGTPLRGIPDTSVRDVMTWDGSAGTVTKNCRKVNATTLTWAWNGTYRIWVSNSLRNLIKPSERSVLQSFLLTPLEYTGVNWASFGANDKTYSIDTNGDIGIKDDNYDNTKQPDFDIIYELATPTTEPLTQTENESIAGLRTFQPQTHAQNNAQTEMTVEAYAGTENGKAVNELKQDVQSEISALKITQSGTLTLTTSGWTNNAQTIAYAHDTAKRNVIDVDPSSVEEWANCGILATAETASGITFSCKTVPTNALNFRVTSMGV